jgi:MarR family 2-MHQ and catechol resistance regulon transcriptional repressor
VLEALLHKGPLAVNELGAKVLLTSGSITTAIDRLERKGLVTRGNDPRDRRARIIRLTAPGRKLIRGAFADHERAMEQAVSHLKNQDRVTLIKLLRHLGRGHKFGQIRRIKNERPKKSIEHSRSRLAALGRRRLSRPEPIFVEWNIETD